MLRNIALPVFNRSVHVNVSICIQVTDDVIGSNFDTGLLREIVTGVTTPGLAEIDQALAFDLHARRETPLRFRTMSVTSSRTRSNARQLCKN